MLISLAAAFAVIGLRPYENDNDNSLSVLSYVQISLVMICGLVLKSQDLVSSETSFDKENLGYVRGERAKRASHSNTLKGNNLAYSNARFASLRFASLRFASLRFASLRVASRSNALLL